MWVLLTLLVLTQCTPDIVVTKDGAVRGIVGPDFRSFLGIPFAQPPVGDLRFENPAPPKPWKLLNATSWRSACPQLCDLPPMVCPEQWSEDCLYLNVYTPKVKNDTTFPVLVFLHGGHFDQGYGGGPLYEGTNYVAQTQTILVTFNYRLGALGFLSTENGLKGNYGFFDQLTVLRWVKDNILGFSGDPNRVTLIGESAGATSVGAHLVSPLSKGLFRNAILQSNPFSIPMSDKADSDDRGNTFNGIVGCKDNKTLIKCLKSKTAKEIVAAQKKMIHLRLEKFIQLFLPWTPVIDQNVIPLHVQDGFKQGKWNKVPMILGNDADDAILFVYGAKNASILSLPEYLVVIGVLFRNESAPVQKQYPTQGLLKDHRGIMSRLGTDYIFTCPTRFIASLAQSQDAPVFLYMFNHSLSWDGWGPEFAYCNRKACHAVELAYQFTTPSVHRIANWTKDEWTLSRTLIQSWTNFAYTNDPNLGPFSVSPFWPKWDPQTKKSLNFQTPSNFIEQGLMGQKCDFWDSLAQRYHFGW